MEITINYQLSTINYQLLCGCAIPPAQPKEKDKKFLFNLQEALKLLANSRELSRSRIDIEIGDMTQYIGGKWLTA